MALITCPECGKQFSDRAEKCPQCGTSKEEILNLIEEKEAQEAAECERIRKEREAKEAEEARIRAERWKKNRKYVFLLIFIILCVISYFPINAYLHTPKWKLADGVLTISPRFSFEATMKDYDYQYRNKKAPWYSKKDEIKSIIIDDGVKNIGQMAFFECFKLTSITIPNSVSCIGDEAFNGCGSLTSVTINSDAIRSGNFFDDADCIIIIEGRGGMSDIFGPQVTNYVIGDSFTSIGDYAFYGCSGLTSVTIPNSVTKIGSYAFAGCSKLTSITIPNSVTSISNWAFYQCKSLSIRLPERFRGKVDLSECKSVTYY